LKNPGSGTPFDTPPCQEPGPGGSVLIRALFGGYLSINKNQQLGREQAKTDFKRMQLKDDNLLIDKDKLTWT
jgi:hypothetical protein